MDLSNDPGFLVAKLAHAMSNELDSKLRVYGITFSQWTLLRHVWEQEGRSQVELQALLNLEAATITGLLQRMTNQGWVSRRPDPANKRVQRVYLTERGRALEQVTAPLTEVDEQAFRGFNADERDFFLRLLRRALGNFEQR